MRKYRKEGKKSKGKYTIIIMLQPLKKLIARLKGNSSKINYKHN